MVTTVLAVMVDVGVVGSTIRQGPGVYLIVDISAQAAHPLGAV